VEGAMRFNCLISLIAAGFITFPHPQTAAAQPGGFVRCEINAALSDGGRAAGYVVMDSLGGCRPGTLVLDYRIYVTGGNEQALPPFVWDRTNSTPFWSGLLDPGTFFYLEANEDAGCPDPPRRLSLLFGVGESNCLGYRGNVAGPVAEPLVMLRVNGSAADVVQTGPTVNATFDMYPTGWSSPVSWYWALSVNGQVHWAGPAGLTPTPQVLSTTAPYETGTLTLFEQEFEAGTVISMWFFGLNGQNVVAFDAITAVVGAASP
jgi:hypothetical protein